jgi:hypothetical protein
MNAVALALLAMLTLAAFPLQGELPPLPRVSVPPKVLLGAAAGLLGVSTTLAWAAGPGPTGRITVAVAAVLGTSASVTAGGPVVVALLRLADKTRPRSVPGPADPRLLNGGAWIGALERLAVTTALLAGRPEGVVVVVAVKGLGRYPELRAPAAAERFIIGTLTSLLWATGCAAAAIAVRH